MANTVSGAVLASLLLVAANTATATNSSQQPHIIFVLVDDLGFNDVSWHNPGVVMPNIHQLATTGVILEQSYVLAVCSPTRSALLTGRQPYTIGRQSSALKPMRPTGLTLNATLLPEVLRGAGYATHMVGKWHLGFCKWEYTPTYRGFDSFLGYYLGGQSYYTHTRSHKAKLGKGRKKKVSGYDYRLDTEPYYPATQQYSTFAYAAQALHVIEQHDPTRPLFLYLPFQAVHGPTQAPESYVQLYADVKNKKRRTYLGMITALDDAVGSIVQGLKDSGLYDNSVIVFSTDNGGGIKVGGSNWPLKGHKSSLFEGGVRGPAFVHSPLLNSPGTTHHGLVHVVDWYNTLAGLAGANTPEDLDSLDQWQSISQAQDSPRTQFVYNIADVRGNLKAAIRVGKFKLLIGETRGFTTIEPPEGQIFRVTKENMKQFEEDESRTLVLRDLAAVVNNNSRSEDPNGDADMHTFPLPELASYAEEQEFDYSDEDAEYETPSCDGLSKKECRLLNRELANLRSFETVDDFFDKGLDMYLYNIEDDPNEKRDLSSRRPAVVRRLLRALLLELPRVVPADNPPRVVEANPDNYGGVWSPGWC